MTGMKTIGAVAAALALSLLAACSTSGGSGGDSGAVPQMTKRTTCQDWLHWPAQYRLQSASVGADAMGAHDTSVSFHLRFEHALERACHAGPSESVEQMAGTLAVTDKRDFG